MNEKIGLLYRVSSKPQESDGNSLEVQKEMGRRVSKNLGVDYIEFNEGVQSSFNVEVNLRPKLIELFNDIQKKDGIRKVWVFNTDRLGRTSQSWYSILKVFLDYGVQIYIGENFKKPYDLSNSVDKLVIGVLSLISQYDNELRRLRSIMGKRNSLKSGNNYIGSIPPFGYSVEGKSLIENKIEGRYVREMFKMYNEGKSTMDIKIFLDKQIDIKPRRTNLGWNLGTIQNMLRNTVYCGKQVWTWKEKKPNGEELVVDEIEVKTPVLIDEHLWKSVNDRIDDRIKQSNFTKNKKEEQKSLLKGLLKCKKCGLTLNHRYKKTNHYYGRCKEYNWKYNGKKKIEGDCDISKSLRIEETDEKVLNTVIDVVKNSINIRERYKIKNLSPKWEDEENIRIKLKTTKKYIRQKIKEKEKYEDEIVDVEFEIRTSSIPKKRGEKLILKFKEVIDNLDKEIERYEKDLKVISNSRGWVNWLDDMTKGIDDIKKSSIPKKREFLNKNVENIEVVYDKEIQSHRLNILFKYPIVGDSLKFDESGKKGEHSYKKYTIINGDIKKVVELPLVNNRKKRNEKTRDELNNKIIELREEKGYSLNEVCVVLNELKLLTPTKKKWDKPKLSSYYKTIKSTTVKK